MNPNRKQKFFGFQIYLAINKNEKFSFNFQKDRNSYLNVSLKPRNVFVA